MIDFNALAEAIKKAKQAGDLAAAAQESDDGTCNSDCCVIFLPRVRLSSLEKAGIEAYKGRAGSFHLRKSFGQGFRNTAGVEAMRDYLKSAGFDSYVHYVMD